ncbi:MAG: hypothetical protein ACRD0N_03590, partial [Acidimicrobiales bacterium]
MLDLIEVTVNVNGKRLGIRSRGRVYPNNAVLLADNWATTIRVVWIIRIGELFVLNPFYRQRRGVVTW